MRAAFVLATEATMQVLGHPWSINTRKVLMAAAEKGHTLELVLVMVPKGEHKRPEHVALHPFGKVPVLRHDGFVLYETQAINRYLERALSGPALVPGDARGAALVDQWIGVADSYFSPNAQPFLVETLFRRYIGGEPNAQAIEAGRAGMEPVLDTLDRRLAQSAYLAGDALSLADIHFMPYLEYLTRVGAAELIASRKHLAGWWDGVSRRPSWQRVARSGPQPYEAGMTAEVIEQQHRKE
jgi:glutathione S-transferase